ncbi:MAG: PQQ-binding-like beta-propeller repeat protein [Anaerolineales bacterium]
MNWLRKLKLSTILSLLSAILIFSTVFAASGNSQWPSAGHDLSNTHYNSSESKIDVSNVASLTKAWSITTGGDISAIPAADSKTVYVPDWAGNLYAIDQKTGDIVWQHQISDYTGVSGDFVRATPALVGNMLIFGDQGGRFLAGADLIAVNKKDGSLIWVQKVDPYSAAVITQSAVVDVGGPFKYPVVYVGTSSVDEFYNTFGFRGSVLAVNANTGQPIWQTYTVPVGYNGGSVWGSTPVGYRCAALRCLDWILPVRRDKLPTACRTGLRFRPGADAVHREGVGRNAARSGWRWAEKRPVLGV